MTSGFNPSSARAMAVGTPTEPAPAMMMSWVKFRPPRSVAIESSREKRTAEYRITNIECRRVESLRSDYFKINDLTVDSILVSIHRDFFLPFFAVLMLVTNIEINSLFS